MNEQMPAAVGAPVECNVRPALWATCLDDDAELMTDAKKADRKLGSDSFDVPLYDQAALDAAVAAERERMRLLLRAEQAHAADCLKGKEYRAAHDACGAVLAQL